MANTILTNKSAPGIVAKLAAEMLADKVQFVKAVNKEDASTFGKDFENAQPGNTIYVNKPFRPTVGTNADITSGIQDVVEEKAALVLDQRSVVAISLTSSEIATDLALKSWAKRTLDPSMSAIAQNVESLNLAKAVKGVSNLVGTPGTPVNALLTYLQAGQKLDEYLAPQDDERKVLINPAANTASVDALKGLFQASDEIRDQYKKGYMGTTAGFDFMRNNLLPIITNGSATGSITVTTTSTEGDTTLALTGTGSQTLKVGQVFTIGSVFAVHPITKASLGYLAQFVVTADATASSGAFTGVTFQVGGATAVYAGTAGLQNISALPQSGATVTLVGSASTGYVQNIAFHPSFYRYCSVPLVLPEGTDMAARETVDGMSVRVIRDYTVLTDKLIMRLDVLGGGVIVRPEWASRLTN